MRRGRGLFHVDLQIRRVKAGRLIRLLGHYQDYVCSKTRIYYFRGDVVERIKSLKPFGGVERSQLEVNAGDSAGLENLHGVQQPHSSIIGCVKS